MTSWDSATAVSARFGRPSRQPRGHSSPLASRDAGESRWTALLAISRDRARRDHGRRDHDGPGHDHARASGRCRGPRGPNGLRETPSLRDSGRSVDVSSMPLQTEDAPNVPGSTCNGDPLAPNILRSKRSPGWEAAAPAPHKRPLVARSRYTPKSALNSARRWRPRAVRQTSSSISCWVSSSKTISVTSGGWGTIFPYFCLSFVRLSPALSFLPESQEQGAAH
jgi:hypothetical protein